MVMTLISIDPSELTAVAGTVRSSAVEVADIGAALSSCVACAMPPDIESLVTQIVAVMDRILDEMARRLNVAAEDLLVRAGLASHASLTTASSAFGPGIADIAAGTTGLIGGGGGGLPEAYVMTPQEALYPTSMTIGGFGATPAATPSTLIGGSMTIGGPTNFTGIAALMMSTAERSQRKTEELQNALRNPNLRLTGPLATSLPLYNPISTYDPISTRLAPSPMDYEDKFGYRPTRSQFEGWAGPHAVY
jgi:hypothetical protein